MVSAGSKREDTKRKVGGTKTVGLDEKGRAGGAKSDEEYTMISVQENGGDREKMYRVFFFSIYTELEEGRNGSESCDWEQAGAVGRLHEIASKAWLTSIEHCCIACIGICLVEQFSHTATSSC